MALRFLKGALNLAKTLKEKQEQFIPRIIPSPTQADKEKLLKYIKEGDKILEISAGSTQLTQSILNKFDNIHITAVDSSPEGIEKILEKVDFYPDKVKLSDVDFLNFITRDKYDVIIFCSSIHEILSYTERNGKRYDLNIIGKIMRKACELLKPGGRILIRDTVASDIAHKITLQFKDKTLEKLANIYIKDFTGFPMEIRKTGVGYVMSYNAMAEMLYAIMWGEEELPKEARKFKTYFSLKDWEDLSFYTDKYYGVKLKESFEYLQKEYEGKLEGKVKIYSSIPENPSRKLIPLPNSNAIVVFEKAEK